MGEISDISDVKRMHLAQAYGYMNHLCEKEKKKNEKRYIITQ
jgi:hypothetical protein